MCAKTAEKPRIIDMDIRKIVADPTAQARDRLNDDVVAEYAEIYKRDPGAMDPPLVFTDGGERAFLGDGFHRLAGAKLAERKRIRVEARVGGLRDARLCAAAANRCHGLRRTNADKRRAVRILLDDAEWSKWSDRKIAEHVGVSNQLVSDMRNPETARAREERKRSGVSGTDKPPDKPPARGPLPGDEPRPPAPRYVPDQPTELTIHADDGDGAAGCGAPEGRTGPDEDVNCRECLDLIECSPTADENEDEEAPAPAGSPAPTATSSAAPPIPPGSGPRDALRNLIPPHALVTWEPVNMLLQTAANDLQALAASWRAGKRALEAAADRGGFPLGFDLQKVVGSQLLNLMLSSGDHVKLAEAAVPHAICPACHDGAGVDRCGLCHGLGWVTRAGYEGHAAGEKALAGMGGR